MGLQGHLPTPSGSSRSGLTKGLFNILNCESDQKKDRCSKDYIRCTIHREDDSDMVTGEKQATREPEEVVIEAPPGLEPVGKGKKLSPEEEKYLALVRELTDAATFMVVKVAACGCPNCLGCEVYQQGRAIAKTIDKIQSIKGVGTAFGKGRRKVRA